ncbi:Hypothetical protein PENO1_110180 [Penicillium occitanis (nom. inval.)]|nr:Hypothetical protein PENO1_110180 [Penicillium occitanis (nom. inval.)]
MKDAKQKKKRPKDSRQKRLERRLTLDFTESLKKKFGVAAKLYENHPEKLFDYIYKRIEDLEQIVVKAQERDTAEDSEYDEEVSSWQEQNAELWKQVKDQQDAMVKLIAERDNAIVECDDVLAHMRELAHEGITSTTSIS